MRYVQEVLLIRRIQVMLVDFRAEEVKKNLIFFLDFF